MNTQISFWANVRSSLGYDVSSVCLSVCYACIVAKPYVAELPYVALNVQFDIAA